MGQSVVMLNALIYVLHCVVGCLMRVDWSLVLDGVVAVVVVHGVLHYVLMRVGVMVDGVFHHVLVGVHVVIDWLFVYIGHCVVGWGVPVSIVQV